MFDLVTRAFVTGTLDVLAESPNGGELYNYPEMSSYEHSDYAPSLIEG